MLLFGTVAHRQGILELSALETTLEEVAVDDLIVMLWHEVKRGTGISHHFLHNGSERQLTNSYLVERHFPEGVGGELMEIDGSSGVLLHVVATHVDLTVTVVVDEDREHVVFDGTLLV